MRPRQASRCSDEKDVLPINKCYAFPGLLRWFPEVSVIGAYISSLMGLVILTESLVAIVQAFPSFQGEKIVYRLLTIIVLGLVGVNYFIFANLCPLIRLREDGLQVRVFTFWFTWKFVPWGEIKKIIMGGYYVGYGGFVWAIQVNRLTFWHCFLGLGWGMGWSPIIVFLPNLEDREELLEIIEAHMGVSQDLSDHTEEE